ncbi:Transglycosylase [Porphyromonadaceae bacterium KH3CP3RA]|nr:Transglycosylase [Porphyromonadaceae bacterium KH3CP3RA]
MKELKEIYYPLSKIDEDKRDIALIELQNAQNLSNNQTKIYSQFANVLIAAATLLISIFLNSERLSLSLFSSTNNLLLFSILLFFIGIILLRYFVDLQKEITINARKVVTLRSMLGLDYSSVRLTLPKDRIEGATNPFNIKFFNGWFKFQAMPFWVILGIVGVIWSLNFYTINISSFPSNKFYLVDDLNSLWFIGLIIIFIIYYILYRISLLDRNETILLHVGIAVSKIFKIKLLKNFEYALYRSKLSLVELERLEINFSELEEILIKIEDNSFYQHKGIDYKAIIRALLSQFKYFRDKYNYLKSGGSTIDMQLARTIFISTNQNKYKRKFLEFFIARWLNQVLTKTEIIKIYIASVRYGHGIMGLSEAIQRYFEEKEVKGYNLSKEESFFLVERLSSISNKVNGDRVDFLLTKINNYDKQKINEIYKSIKQ